MTVPTPPTVVDAEVLLRLADRCEAATEPATEFDALIWSLCDNDGIALTAEYGAPEKAVGIKYGSSGFDGREPIWKLGSYRGPRYTASLDAAMMLLPAHTLWCVGGMEDGPFARIVVPNPNGGYAGGYLQTSAATPVLAICAAALRAIASTLTAQPVSSGVA